MEPPATGPVFDEITKRQGGRRAARRIAWVLGSTTLQMALVAGIVTASGALTVRVSSETLVPVKFVRPAAPRRFAPPPPPPPLRRTTATKQEAERPHGPEPAIVPPKLERPAPPPSEAQGGESTGVAEGGAEGHPESVAGGAAGGVAGGVVGGTAPGPVQPAGPVEFSASMAPPQLLSAPPLEYTQQALDREVEGTMLVECIVSIDGAVRDCRVLKSLPFMQRAVVENLERRRYKPATSLGRPLDVLYVFTIRLKLPE